MDTDISLIIPVHNAEPFLERCLDSAIAQAEPQLEILCINDASTDASRDILDAYASRDRRLRVVHREVNGGESAARNQGLALARGEYLAFLDHDDMLEPDALRLLYQAARASGSDIVRGRVKTVDYEGKASFSPLQLHADICNLSRFYFYTDWWSAVYRANLVQGHITFAEEYPLGGDILFLTEALIGTSRISCIDNLVYTHFLCPESGDSLILSPEKVRSTIASRLRIIELLHQSRIDVADAHGYDYKLNQVFHTGVHLLTERCADTASRLACCDFLFTIKTLHRHSDAFFESLRKNRPQLYAIFVHDDLDALRHIIKTHPDLEPKAFAAAFFTSALRFGISRKMRGMQRP